MTRTIVAFACLLLAASGSNAVAVDGLGPGAADGTPGAVAPLPAQQDPAFAAQALLALLDQPPADGLDLGVALAKEATRWQAGTLGAAAGSLPSTPQFRQPSEAFLFLAQAHGVAPTPEQRDGILALDGLPAGLGAALLRVADAFIGLEAATEAAYAKADVAGLQPLALDGHGLAADAASLLRDAGLDFGSVLASRNALLDAVLELQRAIADPAEQPAHAPGLPLDVCPAFSIDLSGVSGLGPAHSDTYTVDCVLIIDTAGSDAYHNNAGGSDLGLFDCTQLTSWSPTAAALIDLAGNDRYGDPAAPRDCGANGGGDDGVGFLLDQSGDDVYVAQFRSGNGGATIGVGFLLDAAGTDVYTCAGAGPFASPCGALGFNGGGYLAGLGLLIDAGLTRDTYTGSFHGVNGGGHTGVGFLLDRGGNDAYTATFRGTNGGGYDGSGFLLDNAGNDCYVADMPGSGVNGGGSLGTGLLLDGGGSDYASDSAGACGAPNNVEAVPKGLVGAQIDL